MSTFVSKLFIDGGNPQETRKANELLRTKRPQWNRGIEGQTTNPTLVAKNPDIVSYIASGKRLTLVEALAEYKKIVLDVATVTKGPISIQVVGDLSTSKDEFIRQARVYRDWIPNGVIKFPCTPAGLGAAEVFCREWAINLTLNFSQEQAAAVYSATRAHKYRVFISPFVGRLDDIGQNGMEVVASELRMFREHADLPADATHQALQAGNHVEVLTASLRNLNHLLYAIALKSPLITIPFKVFAEWADKGFPLPDANFNYDPGTLKPLPYRQIPLDRPWQEYDIRHELTDKGVTTFWNDWSALLKA